ncbi:hypothetical protein DL96DRAFT_1509485, partial [Flagelloscypha sp. PMI_526]
MIYLGTIILPTFHLECPYRLPLFYRSLEKAERSAVAENSPSCHNNPAGSITWLCKISSNATVKHIAAWSIASNKAWNSPHIWDFLSQDVIDTLFHLVWVVDEQNTVSARALSQLITNAPTWRSFPAAAEVFNSWQSGQARELHRAIEEHRVQ